MDASRPTGRHTLRPFAIAFVLLFTLGACAPNANAISAHHAKAHAVAVTLRVAGDQSAVSARVDQPALAPAFLPSAAAMLIAGRTADPSSTADPSTLDSTRVRGPPRDAH